MEATINHLRQQIPKITEPVGLLGISMGGMIAQSWAKTYPHEISNLVLVNTSSALSPFHQRLNPRLYWGITKTFFMKSPEKIEKFIMESTSNTATNWNPHLAALAEFHKYHPVSAKNFRTQLALSSEADFNKKPSCEVLILASKEDRLVNWHCSQKIADLWQLPLKLHTSAGHDLTLDDPHWVTQQILATR